jgi:hypothetical protein
MDAHRLRIVLYNRGRLKQVAGGKLQVTSLKSKIAQIYDEG